MGLAISSPETPDQSRSSFSSLFVGMGLAILVIGRFLIEERLPFSSLFVGMGLAIRALLCCQNPGFQLFQFPFRRDGPCNLEPRRLLVSAAITFSSLFVGMGLAIVAGSRWLEPAFQAFSSLFVGMGLAIIGERVEPS